MNLEQAKNKSPQALKTISEAADILGLPTHVLRFWETKFDIIKPIKFNNRRYYNPKALETLKQIKSILHEQNYSIQDAITYFKNSKNNSSSLYDASLFPEKLTNKLQDEIKTENYTILIETKEKLILAKNKLNALL